MQVAVVEHFGKPLLSQEWEVPTPGPGQILVKTEACGVCHTDLHAATVDWPLKPKLPFIPGQEAIDASLRSEPVSRSSRRATDAKCRGFTLPAAVASIACRPGSRSVPTRNSVAIPGTAVSSSISLPIRTMSLVSLMDSPRSSPHR